MGWTCRGSTSQDEGVRHSVPGDSREKRRFKERRFKKTRFMEMRFSPLATRDLVLGLKRLS